MLLIAEYVVPVSSEPIEHGAVFIKDGAIADIGDAEMMRLRYPNEEVKDFGMAALTPGLYRPACAHGRRGVPRFGARLALRSVA